jgi:hypothetical protein
MPSVLRLLEAMRNSQTNVRYADLYKVCEYYFGPPRNSGGSHSVFRTSWQGDPRVNIQNDNGKAKPYQVKQVLTAIERKVNSDDNAN